MAGKKRRTALILSIAGGILGIDRFYLGRYWTGIVKLLTGGGLLVWWISDIFQLMAGDLKPAQGEYVDVITPQAEAAAASTQPAAPAQQPAKGKKEEAAPTEPAPTVIVSAKPLPPVQPKAVAGKADRPKPARVASDAVEPEVVSTAEERSQHIAVTPQRKKRARKPSRAARRKPAKKRKPSKRRPAKKARKAGKKRKR